jgi:uracil-DNA glycosylase
MSPDQLPDSWRSALADEFTRPYFHELRDFLEQERANHPVFPPEPEVFTAFQLAPFDRVNVVLLGQDPYHDDGQAHGLCFSVRRGIRKPPSLVNMLKELHDDLGFPIPRDGCLIPWAEQGILMLNAVLTVRAHEANSHKDHGWETFTDAAIRLLSERGDPVVFVLWGAYAQKKGRLIDETRHPVIKSAHPSPLSARKFLGSRPYSTVNRELERLGKPPVDWRLPDL